MSDCDSKPLAVFALVDRVDCAALRLGLLPPGIPRDPASRSLFRCRELSCEATGACADAIGGYAPVPAFTDPIARIWRYQYCRAVLSSLIDGSEAGLPPAGAGSCQEDMLGKRSNFMSGGGEMGALMRAKDWSATPLGPAQGWPQALRIAVRLMLTTRHPVYIFWGADHRCFYNDAYRVSIGPERHPSSLGEPGREIWPEIWADIGPQIEQVMHGGEATWHENQLLPIMRHGRLEDVYWTYSYGPIDDVTAPHEVGGVLVICTETTQQVRAERAAVQDNERMMAMFEQAPSFVAVLRGPDHIFEITNRAYRQLTGNRDLIGLPVREAVPEVAGQGFFELLDQVYRTAQPVSLRRAPLTLADAEGTRTDRLIDFVYAPIVDDQGRTTGILVDGNDITDHVLAEAELRASEERFRAVQESTIDGFVMLDAVRGEDGAIVDFTWSFVNDAATRILARPREAFIGKSVIERLQHSRWLELFDAYVAVAETGVPMTREFLHKIDGLTIELRLVAVRIAGGLAVSFADWSSHRQAEVAAREAATVIENMGEAFLMLDRDFRITRANPEALRIAGGDADAVIGHHLLEVWPEAEHLPTWSEYQRAMADLVPVQMVYQHISVSHDIWLDVRAYPVGDGLAIFYRDVSDRERATREAAHNSRLLGTFLEAVPGVVYAKDREGRLLLGNRGVTALIGKPPEAYIGRTDAEVLADAAAAAAVMAADRAIMESGVAEQLEEDIPLADGTAAVWLSTKEPLRDADGNIVGLIGSSVDITARRSAEAELRELNQTLESRIEQAIAARERVEDALRQSRKLESMGQLTGGVAHDFNNLLTPIIGGLDMLQRNYVHDARAKRLIDGALQSADRAKTLVQRLLAFARRQPLQANAIDVATLIGGMIDLVTSTCGAGIAVTIDVPADLPSVVADANQLEMALLNLAVNAHDAMSGAGRLTIAAGCEAVEDGRAGLSSGRYVRLSVVDSGVGMDAATRARAVEPFFSTKGIGRGTGLGLSMVHGLAAQLDGGLTIASAPGQGTTVTIWLPAATGVAPVPVEATSDGPPVAAAGTALVVDDEALVRESTADMLRDLGYDVVEVSSAQDALALVATGANLTIVVTDHLMPGMTGTELALELRRIIPSVPVVIISGYAEDAGIQHDLPRLTKPFRQSDLAKSLAEAIGHRRRR